MSTDQDQEFDNTNRGVLFRNSNKDSERQPDYTGKIDIDGRDLRLAAWIKTSKDGTKKFMSLTVSDPKEWQSKQDEHQSTQTVTPDTMHDADGPVNMDDIPF